MLSSYQLHYHSIYLPDKQGHVGDVELGATAQNDHTAFGNAIPIENTCLIFNY